MQRTILVLTAFLLAGCAGLETPTASFSAPPEAPKAPATTAPFPAVHDIPPERSTTPLSPEQQQKLERDLAAARARQQTLR